MPLKGGKKLKKVLELLENHLGLIVLIIFVIVILYAAFVFYNFAYLTIRALPEISFEKVEIKEAVFERVAEWLDGREQNILEAMGKEYKDVFK